VKNDQLLHSDVEQEHRWAPGVRAERIGASVAGGVAELDGHVGSYFEKWAAERASRSAPGAATVHDRLRIVEADGVGGRRRGRYL